MRSAVAITLTRVERTRLRQWCRGDGRLARRARIILLSAAGLLNTEIARRLHTDEQTVGRWRNRFATGRLDGIAHELPRCGRKPRARDKVERSILRWTRRRAPDNGTWSTRTLARALGIHHMLVHRVWRRHGLVPADA